MGQTVVFDGKLFTEPVAASRIISGVTNTGSPSSFGNIAIIDSGLGATFGGGVGAVDSVGGNRESKDFVVEVNSAAQLKTLVKGGVLWDLADYIYAPSNNAPGASKVFYMRATQTAKATFSSGAWNGAFTLGFDTKEEGLICNGALDTGNLYKGYAITFEAGVIDPNKFIFKFWQGTYKGQDVNGYEFDGITQTQASLLPKLITQSPELTTVAELVAWATTDQAFQSFFAFTSGSATTGTFAAADLTTFAGYSVFAGGTETYSATAMDNVLDQIKELDNSLFLALENDTNAAGTNNLKIIAHINNEAEFKKFVVIGGGDDSSGFATSKTAAGTIDSRYAALVHGGITEQFVNNPAIDIQKSSIYKAALVTGRLAGLEPQTPLTYKDLRIRKERHVLTPSEREDAINNGVLATRAVPQLGIVVNQAVNTLQLNSFMINNDGTSPEISIERIFAQLNREISTNSRILFIGNNVSTVSDAVVVSFVEGYLQSKLAKPGISDGLIIDFRNVKAERQGTSYFVTYDFQANTPINKIFTTGTVIDPTI